MPRKSTPNQYLSREALLQRATLFEREEYAPELGGVIRYRELTGQERIDAQEAAIAPPASADHPDNDMFRAVIISMGLLEPRLEPDDVFALQKARPAVVIPLADRILSLGDATPDAFRDGDSAPDDGQPAAGAGAESADDDAG